MTDHDAELEQIARAANEIVPELTQRLRRQGLGHRACDRLDGTAHETALSVASGPLVRAVGEHTGR